ncbi:MAG TPA: type I-C CRISPR-associated protein Cas8c/Csd1 [Candidatus Angelobacter sp.]|nr:type I-C CRISPR-associated protein Cas8c/Csd1 [Candidatus Angelobacter sp.]
MSWIQKLHATYDLCADAPQFATEPLMPVSHIEQQAHIEIMLDAGGNFQRAALVPKEATVVPATEKSAGRVGTKPPPHPLCDKIQYCAADYPAFGGGKESFYNEYLQQLQLWAKSGPNPKVQAVLNYVENGTVVSDLVREGILHCSADQELLTEWSSDQPTPGIFKMLTPKDGKRDQGDAFVRWRVQIPGDPVSAVWSDPEVRDSWIRFDASQNTGRGLCMVTGEATLLASSHPKRLRHGADGAKLISSNDNSGYTFRGRFQTPEQAYGVGAVVTQKAHNALQWLIKRQGYHDKSSGQVFIAWTVGGQQIPDPFQNTARLFLAAGAEDGVQDESYSGDVGQHFALRLNTAISGYGTKLGDCADVVIMGLDSATPGRMAITYYRELIGAEFLDRVLRWHLRCAWRQNYSKDLRFVGAPAPNDIAAAAYGRRLDDHLRKATVERLLPCIIDARPLPRSVVEATVHRASNRMGLEKWEWEKCIGIACALVRGSRWEENYRMSLEEDRTTRDYLFGRLLAIAENIESHALYVAKEKRDTNAAKLMQRFADHPCSTWRSIELSLTPYKTRLRTNRPGVLLKREKLLDSVIGMFTGEDFTNDSKLSGEFLLGYHCQRSALWNKAATEIETEESKSEPEGEEG